MFESDRTITSNLLELFDDTNALFTPTSETIDLSVNNLNRSARYLIPGFDLVDTFRQTITAAGAFIVLGTAPIFIDSPDRMSWNVTTWQISRSRRRKISLREARQLAFAALERAETIRAESAREEARRTASLEVVA